MSTSPLPADLRRFILTSIPSVPFLEALLLFRAHAQPGFSRGEIASRLYLSEAAAGRVLAALEQSRFVAAASPDADRYAYNDDSPERTALVDRLAEGYSTHLIEITHLIHDETRRSATQFADAFRWRKD